MPNKKAPKNKTVTSYTFMERKNSPNGNHQLTCFIRPELIHGPLCFHKANPHNHMINLVLWDQNSAADDKGDHVPPGRVAATAGILRQSFPSKAREHGNGASVLTLPPTLLMTLVTSLHDTLLPPQPLRSVQVLHPIGCRSTGTSQHQSDATTTTIRYQCDWWGATPARDRLPITNIWTGLTFSPICIASVTYTHVILSNLLQEVMPRLFCLLSKKDSM